MEPLALPAQDDHAKGKAARGINVVNDDDGRRPSAPSPNGVKVPAKAPSAVSITQRAIRPQAITTGPRLHSVTAWAHFVSLLQG
jgi:hypothetical protein